MAPLTALERCNPAAPAGVGRGRDGSDGVVQGAVLEATLERITYANEDTGYIVAKVDTGRGGDLVTVVGCAAGCPAGGGAAAARAVGFPSAVRAAVPCGGLHARCCRRPCRASAVTWGRG